MALGIMDIVTLAKAGYKKDDVKDLIDLTKELEKQEAEHNSNNDEMQKLQEELNNTKKALEEAQKKNLQQDNGQPEGSPKKTKEDFLSDLDKLFS